MFGIRKFYNDDAVQTAPAMPNIAELIAKQGIKLDSNEDDSVAIPDIKIKQEIPTTQATPPVAPTEMVQPQAPPNVETPVQKTNLPVAAPPVQTAPAAQAPQADWKEQLKKAERKEVLKEMGFDDKMVGFLNKWQSSGDVKEYLEAMSVDYSKLTSEDVMRRHLRDEYPGLEPDDFEELYQMKVVDQYKLNPDQYSETEVKRGKILLNADSRKIRDQFVAKQQELILSKPPEAPDPQAQWMEAQAKEVEKYNTALNADPLTRQLVSTKKLVIGEGEDAFSYEIADPAKLISSLEDPAKWASLIFNQDGTPNIGKQLLLSAIANDDVGLFKTYSSHFKALGAKQVIDPIDNASLPAATPAKPTGPLTPAEAMARGGIMTAG